MNYAMLKVAMQAAQDEIRQAAVGTSYKYSQPMVIMSISDTGIGVTVFLGTLERKADKLQSFDEAIIETQLMARRIVGQLDTSALARTLGVEVSHA
jgi:hypothetical protein